MIQLLFTIKPHSSIDVITNSSTELFICDKKQTLEMIEEALKTRGVTGYLPLWIFDLKEYRIWRENNRHRKYPDYDHNYHMVEGWFKDTEDEEDVMELRKNYIEEGDRREWNSNRNQYYDRLYEAQRAAEKKNPGQHGVGYHAKDAEVDKIYEEVNALDVKPDWWTNPIKYHYNDMTVNDLDGSVMILGDGDNSFRWEDVDWIEETFNTTRRHLG